MFALRPESVTPIFVLAGDESLVEPVVGVAVIHGLPVDAVQVSV